MADDKPADVEMADTADDGADTKKKSSKSGSAPRFEIKKWNAGAFVVCVVIWPHPMFCYCILSQLAADYAAHSWFS
jgi:hypothetical protein